MEVRIPDRCVDGNSVGRRAVSRHIPKGDWWLWDCFPIDNSQPLFRGGKYKIDPKGLSEVIGEYACGTESIAKILEKRGWSNSSFSLIRHRFPAVEQSWREAQKAKADMYGSEAVDVFQREIPVEFWSEDKFGNKILSMSGVRYLEAKSAAMWRSAAAHESGTYQTKTQIESKNLNVNVNAGLELKDLMGMGIEGLMRPDD